MKRLTGAALPIIYATMVLINPSLHVNAEVENTLSGANLLSMDHRTYNVLYFGAVGDGKADDTAAIQAAIDVATQAGGGIVTFPPGDYLVSSIGINHGLTLLGYGATIKKKPNEPKFSRTFTTGQREYSGQENSPPLIIKGFHFDGSRSKQGPYTQYELEQQHMIFLVADKKTPGKLMAIIEDCTFRDGVGDAISIYTNVSAQISNCSANNVFRGGVVVTGGHSDVQVSNFKAQGDVHPTGIDIEVDGLGYGESYRVEITMNNLLLEGDFDVSLRDKSTFFGSNIISRNAPFYVGGQNSIIKIMNSSFGVGEFSNFSNRIVFPHDVTFVNCTFRASEPYAEEAKRKLVPVHVYWNISTTNFRDETLRFIDCDFQLDPEVEVEDDTYAIYLEAERLERNNRLLIRGGTIADSFDYGVYAVQGATLSMQDITLNANTGLWFGSGGDYLLDVRLDGLRFGKNTQIAEHINSQDPRNILDHRNHILHTEHNTLSTSNGLTRNTYRGHRDITGTTPPKNMPGLAGDRYHLVAPQAGVPDRWVCTRSDAVSATWKALERIAE